MAMYDQSNVNNTGAGAIKLSTNSIALFSADSTMLRIGFESESMFLTIIPRIADPNGGKPRWPKEMGRVAPFRPQTALSLYEGFKRTILPDMEAGKSHDGYCVVPLNRDNTNLCGFNWVDGTAKFTIFNGVSQDRTCSDAASYTFAPTVMIDHYNPTTGTYDVFEVQGQLFIILEALRIFGQYSCNAVGHLVKSGSAWNTDMMQSHLRAIANKLGAIPGQYGRYRGSEGFGGGFGGGVPFTSNSGAVSVSTFNNPAPAPAADGEPPFSVYGTAQSALQQPEALGGNDGVSWNTAVAESSNVGHNNVAQVTQVSSLESLMA